VTLTAAGRLLVAHADVILADMARAAADLEVAKPVDFGSATVAAFPTAARKLPARGARPAGPFACEGCPAAAPGAPTKLGALADSDWLVPVPDVACHEMVQRAYGATRFVVRTIDFIVLAALVAPDAGVALMPRMSLPSFAVLALFSLASPLMRRVNVLTCPGERGRPEIARVVATLHTAAPKPCPPWKGRP
jgi:DNA-binding transcriptional LysR family regulator